MTATYAQVAALISKLPAGNPIRKAFNEAKKREAEYSARANKAWKSRRAAAKGKRTKKATRH